VRNTDSERLRPPEVPGTFVISNDRFRATAHRATIVAMPRALQSCSPSARSRCCG